MILSDDHKFIFMAVPKTGTSTIHELLTPYGWRSPINEYANHLTIDGAKRCPLMLGDFKWKKYKKVAFVRNPWDRYLALTIMISKWNKSKRYAAYNDLADYIRSGGYQGHHQHEFLINRDGVPEMDFIGRFENLEEDIVEMFQFLKLPMPNKIHHSNNSKIRKGQRKHYAEYYTEQWMIDAVAEREQYVIERFGYKFGEDGDRWR